MLCEVQRTALASILQQVGVRKLSAHLFPVLVDNQPDIGSRPSAD